MTGIYPLPYSGRTSELLLYSRSQNQASLQERLLLKVQEQVSTGRRISRPSEDPLAAARAITYQRSLEFNAQFQSNVTRSGSVLKETESLIATHTDLLRDVRGLATQGVDVTVDDRGREAIVTELGLLLNRFVELANSNSQGRYLFAGSNPSIVPYSDVDGSIVFNGNQESLSTFIDIAGLIDSNISGLEVFGGQSAEVKSTVDLNPVLTGSTQLDTLHRGRGVFSGSIEIFDGTNSSIIEISSARNLDEVARLIERNEPLGRQIDVSIESDHLELTLDSAGGGYLAIREVNGGNTAYDLGILTAPSDRSLTVVGKDLDPSLTPSTRIDEIIGVRASTLLESVGNNNDLIIEAKSVGPQFNNYSFQFVDDDLLQAADGVAAGDEFVDFSATPRAARAALSFNGTGNDLILTAATPGAAFNQVDIAIVDGGAIGDNATVNYNATNGVLQIGVDSSGATRIQTVINALAADGTFTASYDSSDPGDGGFNPNSTVLAADIGNLTGNTSNSGGDANTVFIHINAEESTAADVINAFEANSEVSDNFGIRLDVFDSLNGKNNGSGTLDATLAAQTTNGEGTPLDRDSGLRIQVGTSVKVISLQEAETVQDFLNLLNHSGLPIQAEINGRGDSIDIYSRASGADFAIGENGGTTATQLGLRSFTDVTRLDDLNYGLGVGTADGTDFSIRRNDGSIIDIDISAAETVGDVIDIINAHPGNQDPTTQVLARLALTGNGIEIVDDNPPGEATVAIVKADLSSAAIDLGLIPVGKLEGYPSDAPPPTPATLDVSFSPPNQFNTDFRLTANTPGTELNGVTVQFVNSSATGDQAIVNFDSGTKTLTIDVDPTATTAKTVIQQISLEGTFNAELRRDVDLNNNGLGLVPAAGAVGITAGGSSQSSASKAFATLAFPVPNDVNTAFRVDAAQAGTLFNDVEIIFQDTLAGDNASVSYDSINKQLLVSLDASATTANTIVNAINLEGTFEAALDLTNDATNDGSGVVGQAGSQATTAGGTPEVLVGRDVNPIEAKGVFNSISRLITALDGELDLPAAERASSLLAEDLNRALNALGDVSARQRLLGTLENQLEEQSISFQESISNDIDVDMLKAVSELTARQTSYQASLQMIGRLFQTSLLDFI